MFLAGVLWLWALTLTPTPTTPTLQVHPHPPHSPVPLSRLDQLEGLVADREARWQREQRVLTEKLHLLQEDIHTLHMEKREMKKQTESLQTQAQTLTAENRALKTELGEVHRQLVSMSRTQQSLQDTVTQCGTTRPRPDRDGDGERGDGERGDGERGDGERGDGERGDGEHHQEDKNPIQQQNNESSSSQHVLTARSDDHEPLEAVTSHLAQQITLLTADVQALKTSDAQQHRDIQAAQGSSFVQWGSSTCGESSDLVYSGVMGGSWWEHGGAAVNALCLTQSPKLQNWPPDSPYYASVYGAEYETHDSHYQMDPVCAVCRSRQPSTIMVPGTNVCSSGWTLQYSGFLMAGWYGHSAATQFICVDAKMESRSGSNANNDGYLLYYTKTHCGSLPCLPYEDNKRMTCVVCSK